MTTLDLAADRLARARISLEGLAVGDAFGGRFFAAPGLDRTLPPAPWRYSDDTAMALGVVAILGHRGGIDRDDLAAEFARAYAADPDRGYGQSVRRVLGAIGAGTPWREATRLGFGGAGSLGNGGAMRAAPVGAYFADDPAEVARQAGASAEVTHAHPEGIAGAVAVALAAAWAWRARDAARPRDGSGLIRAARDGLLAGEVRAGLDRALALGLGVEPIEAARTLGDGGRITAPDTVPFALWCAGRFLDDYAEALWATVAVGGDNDTNCAIVGGIVVLGNGPGAIPGSWRDACERLPAGP